MVQAERKEGSHFWDEEYFAKRDDDIECTRIIYKGHPFHILSIDESTYVITDNVCSCLGLDDYSSLEYLNQIDDLNKSTRCLRRSNKTEYEVALLNEQGLCDLIGLVNTPEAHDLLHDIQGMIRRVNAPATGAYARIAERFAVAKRKRIEANPSLISSPRREESHPLSSPAYYSRPLLGQKEIQPASILTLDASTSLQMYRDVRGNFWFESGSVMKALGKGAVADPASVFADVPSCWVADLTTVMADGREKIVPCILLQGLIFYLSSSANLSSVYLMYYIALQISILYNRKTENLTEENERPVPLADSSWFGEDIPVRYTVDINNQLWYVLGDIEAICGGGGIFDGAISSVPASFLMHKVVLEGVGMAVQKQAQVFISEQGLWFLLAQCSANPKVNALISRLSSTPIRYEDRLNLYRRITQWSWPYVADLSEVPSYSMQLQGLHVILSAIELDKTADWALWGLDAVAEATTGISPLTVIQRWQSNIKKKESTSA